MNGGVVQADRRGKYDNMTIYNGVYDKLSISKVLFYKHCHVTLG